MLKATKVVPEWKVAWDKSKHHIERALKRQDLYTLEDVEDRISRGIFHIWAGKNSAFVVDLCVLAVSATPTVRLSKVASANDSFAFVTEFVTFPRCTIMNLLFCGGNYEELESMLPYIEAFAKKAGCKRLYGGGRKGWIRKIKHLGFEEHYTIKKDL